MAMKDGGLVAHVQIGRVLVALLFLAACTSGVPGTPTATSGASPSASVSPGTSTEGPSPPATASPAGTSPQPTSTPQPTPSAQPSASPPVSLLVSHGDRSGRQVALTLDMGGRVAPALDIMALLTAHQVPATIFMTGAIADSASTDAGREVLAVIEAHPELFDLGNHSYSHPDFRTLTPAHMRDELARTEVALAAWCGHGPRPLFRPPYGGWNAQVLATVGAAGYTRTVLWDVDTIDWKPISDGGPTADQIVAKVLANAAGGSIVLMHLGGYETLAALPRVVDGLRARGLEPVTLATLLGV